MNEQSQNRKKGITHQLEIEITGKTPEDALQKALQELNKKPEDVTYEIIEEGKRGFLGMGKRLAQIKVKYESIEPVGPYARQKLESLLKKMGLDLQVTENEENDSISLLIDGKDIEYLTKDRRVLGALQYMLNLILGRQTKGTWRIWVGTPNSPRDDEQRSEQSRHYRRPHPPGRRNFGRRPPERPYGRQGEHQSTNENTQRHRKPRPRPPHRRENKPEEKEPTT